MVLVGAAALLYLKKKLVLLLFLYFYARLQGLLLTKAQIKLLLRM
jgi:hypothetical protein